MSTLRLALAQQDFPVGDVTANGERIEKIVRQAAAQGASLAVFPELAVSGYPPDDLLLRPSFIDACGEEMKRLAEASLPIRALVGYPRRDQGDKLFNAAALLGSARSEPVVAVKQVLPNYAVFDEKRYFAAGDCTGSFIIDDVRVAVLVCEDVWADAPIAGAREAGAELVVVINASPWDIGKQVQREATLARHARVSGCAIVYLNLVGGQDDLLFDGSSMLINADGGIVARAPAFRDELLMATFDSDTGKLQAEGWPVVADDDQDAVVYAGLVRGLRDYVGKNGFADVLLGLSGGIDSALTATLAVDALGAEHVHAVMLPSQYTSEVSLDGARDQAQALGIDYRVVPIEPTFASMLETLQPAFDGKPEDLTEENLQARIRGALLMALSNKHRQLLLATGNKSEMAVGYSTLYGDMCGGFAPLKDVYKTIVYRLARWRNRKALAEGEPERIPQAVIERPPSAELRADQTDQDSLPPYDELDAILERFIEGDEAIDAIVAAGHDRATVERVTRMVFNNEFKRRQAAPGPKITRRAFGRERRYPISSQWR